MSRLWRLTQIVALMAGAIGRALVRVVTASGRARGKGSAEMDIIVTARRRGIGIARTETIGATTSRLDDATPLATMVPRATVMARVTTTALVSTGPGTTSGRGLEQARALI